MTQEHLKLAEGDEVFYIGTGVLGSKIAQEMAAQQQLAADQQRSTGHVRSWDSSRGEPSVAGLLLLDAEGEIPRKSLAENAYALFAVARGEATSEMSAQADAVSFEEFERGLRKAHGHQSPLAALEYAEVFRRSSSQSEWDRRVDKALHTTRCGLKLAAEHVNKVKYTGSTLIVSSAEVRTRGIGDAKEAAHSPHVMREVRMDWHDSLALSHVDELANIIIAKLLG